MLVDQAAVITTIADACRTDPTVLVAYLFGSVARGTDTAKSDIDVGIVVTNFQSGSFDALRLDLKTKLDLALGREVDLVVMNAAPVDLIHRILWDGIIAHEADRSARIRFEVDARNRYFDLLPVLKRYRKGDAA